MKKNQSMCSLVATCLERAGLEVITLEYSLKLKIKRNDWLLTDMCPQAANHCAFLSLRLNSLACDVFF